MRRLSQWPAPLPAGGTVEEMVLQRDHDRAHRLLVLPALFDEANKLRRFTAEVMRRLDHSGIDSFLPDLPGTNESPASLADQTLDSWRLAAEAAARHFRATQVLTIRGGALLAPPGLPGWRFAPVGGDRQICAMLRARTIAAREAGREETLGDLQEVGKREGIELAGWRFGAPLFSDLATARTPDPAGLVDIEQDDIGGSALWLRAEPGEDHVQADALAAFLAISILSA